MRQNRGFRIRLKQTRPTDFDKCSKEIQWSKKKKKKIEGGHWPKDFVFCHLLSRPLAWEAFLVKKLGGRAHGWVFGLCLLQFAVPFPGCKRCNKEIQGTHCRVVPLVLNTICGFLLSTFRDFPIWFILLYPEVFSCPGEGGAESKEATSIWWKQKSTWSFD